MLPWGWGPTCPRERRFRQPVPGARRRVSGSRRRVESSRIPVTVQGRVGGGTGAGFHLRLPTPLERDRLPHALSPAVIL